MGLINKLFGTRSEREIKKFTNLVDQVMALEDSYRQLSDEALKAMPAGSEWEIYIPYDQGYGPQGGGPFPPFSTLIFKVTLVSVGH